MLQLVDRELKAEGVDTNHYAALSTIGAFGPLALTELASELGMPLTTASGRSPGARTRTTAARSSSS
jgi:hypothetical protein